MHVLRVMLDAFVIFGVCFQKPETVEVTAGPTATPKAKKSTPKIKEDKEEDVKEVEAKGEANGEHNGDEAKAEPMDEADGPAVRLHVKSVGDRKIENGSSYF